jgi:chromosome segregation ATPase
LQNIKAAIAQREQDQAAIVEASYANEQQLTDARTAVSDLHLQAERTRSRLDYQTRQIQQIEQRLTHGQQELQGLDEKRQKSSADLEQQTSELSAIEASCGEARRQLEAKSTERQDRQSTARS